MNDFPFIPTLKEVHAALAGNLREGIPISDYVNELYKPTPIGDFETTGQHEIPSFYSATGNPIVCEV
jgi:hypothetical protein